MKTKAAATIVYTEKKLAAKIEPHLSLWWLFIRRYVDNIHTHIETRWANNKNQQGVM